MILNRLSSPARRSISSFLLLSLLMLGMGLLERNHILNPSASTRVIGLLVAIMMIITGNYLPKARPLKALDCVSAPAAAAERQAGWALALGGIVNAVAFLFFPFGPAMLLSSSVGATVVLFVAASWIPLARWKRQETVSRSDGEAVARASGRGEREMLVLFVAMIWILATGFLKHFWADSTGSGTAAAWFVLSVGVLYAAVIPILNRKDCQN